MYLVSVLGETEDRNGSVYSVIIVVSHSGLTVSQIFIIYRKLRAVCTSQNFLIMHA
jgi:hypothetical protein